MGHSMEMSIFLSLAFTEILHLKNTWLQFFYIYILKMKRCVIWTIIPSWAINVAIFVLIIIKNSKHHKTARYSHVQRERAWLGGQKQVFLPFKIK